MNWRRWPTDAVLPDIGALPGWLARFD